MDAMHGLCIACHEESAGEEPDRFGDLLPRCDACHDADYARMMEELAPLRRDAGSIVAAGH
jgi:hypothetical protein